jgi:hypothetical protein
MQEVDLQHGTLEVVLEWLFGSCSKPLRERRKNVDLETNINKESVEGNFTK